MMISRASARLAAGVTVCAFGLVTALAACSRGGGGNKTPTHVTDGKVLFETYCARCHGAEGTGGPATEAGPGPRNFHDTAFHASHTDEQLRATIVNGKGTAMPAFGATFDDEQLHALVGQLRTFGGAKK